MQELISLNIEALIDMLSHHTADYSRRLSEGATEDECSTRRATIIQLQSEIESRKKAAINTNLPEPKKKGREKNNYFLVFLLSLFGEGITSTLITSVPDFI